MKFGTQAVKVGDTFTGDYTAKVDVLHAVDGIPTEKAHENRMFHSSYEMTVTELDRELPETVRVRYTGGREYILSEGDLEDDDHEHLGDALIASEGSYERPGGGGLSDRHDALVLDRDVGRVGTPGTIQAQLRGQSLEVGQTLRITPGEIRDRFNGEDGSMLEISLRGMTERCKRDVAVFDASVEVVTEIEGGVAYIQLTGDLEVDVATAMPVALSLEGPAQTAYDFDMPRNGGGTASVEGTLKPKGCR